MDSKLNIFKLIKRTRGDVSALLIIAFVFQFFTPIAVLANDASVDTAFESSLRHSICRVEIETNDDDDSSVPQTAHTDGFVCDWCVLCSVSSSQVFERLPDVRYQISSLAKSALDYGRVENQSPSLASRDKSTAPRGPPADLVSRYLTIGTFQILATFTENPAGKII